MLESLNAFNFTIFILFLLLYLYQIIYAGVVLCGRKKPTPEAKQMHRYGVIIAARNEATVIRELLQSIKAQNYPDGLVTAFVVADNCTDNTAELAQAEGALGNRDQELAARAESMALVGQLEQAISLLSSASSQVKLGSLQQARYDARIDQLRDLQARFRPYQKM